MQLWDGERLRDAPEVTATLLDRIAREPALGELRNVRHPDRANMGVVFAGTWGAAAEPVVLKLNCAPLEIEWMCAVSRRQDGIVPRVHAAGSALAGLDVGWLLLQAASHRFDSAVVSDSERVMRAAARFQAVAETMVDLETYRIDREFLQKYLGEAVAADCPGPGETVLARLARDLEWVEGVSPQVRCHGDVHFGNVVAVAPDTDPLLIDPIPRIADWAWDAAYAQGTSGVPGTPRLVPLLAAARTALGLPICAPEHLDRLEATVLGWASMMWWAIIPFRRADSWWTDQVRGHVTRLAGWR